MSLFPSIGVAGHSAEDGLNPDGGALQKVIGKNLFKESDRGAPFRRKLASVLERVRSPVRMPRLNRSDREMFYPLSVVVKDVDFEFVTASPAAHVPRRVPRPGLIPGAAAPMKATRPSAAASCPKTRVPQPRMTAI